MELRELKTKASEAFAKGKFAKAADLYSDYCESDPKDLHARLRMGDAWAKSGKKEKAILAYKSAAEGFARDGFLPRAIAASKLILELDPKHQGMQQMLADLYARKSGPALSDNRPRQPPPPARENRAAPSAKPAEQPASSSFADRKDAIELPEYEVPRDEPPKPAPKVDGPSPMNRKDAIELPPDDSDRGPRQVLGEAAIELTLPPAPAPAAAVGAFEVEEAPPEELTEFEEIEVEDGPSAHGGKEIVISVEHSGQGGDRGIEISLEEPALDRSADLPPELQLYSKEGAVAKTGAVVSPAAPGAATLAS
ncbi:MAG: tetratricopeptide repeat protein, partial [Myxococcaceae bacterium]